MGRRNEKNRLEHKKKVDAKKKRERESKEALKVRRKQIINKNNLTHNEPREINNSSC